MSSIKIKAQLHLTEDPKKVIQAITNLFGNIKLTHDADRNLIMGKLSEINQLKELRGKIAQDRIRTTLYRILSRWNDGDYLSFGFNRQAAFAGHVSLNLTNEDPMGPIQVQIRGNVHEAIEYLCN